MQIISDQLQRHLQLSNVLRLQTKLTFSSCIL